MGKEADPTQQSNPSEVGHAEQAAEGESKGTPDSGRHQAETAVQRNTETKPRKAVSQKSRQAASGRLTRSANVLRNFCTLGATTARQ